MDSRHVKIVRPLRTLPPLAMVRCQKATGEAWEPLGAWLGGLITEGSLTLDPATARPAVSQGRTFRSVDYPSLDISRPVYSLRSLTDGRGLPGQRAAGSMVGG